MNGRELIVRVRQEFATTSAVRRAADRWGDLQDAYDDLPCHSPARRQVGVDIAACVEEIADGIEASTLASWAGFVGSSVDLRRDAEGWRRGDDMSGEEDCEHVSS